VIQGLCEKVLRETTVFANGGISQPGSDKRESPIRGIASPDFVHRSIATEVLDEFLFCLSPDSLRVRGHVGRPSGSPTNMAWTNRFA
jgi:hypothetical protein